SLEWGRLYEKYHNTAYDPTVINSELESLLGDEAVSSPKGIYEYLLSDKTKTHLLAVRLFDDKTKKAAFERQTTPAKAAGTSNCPLCTVGNNANKSRIYAMKEMDADHVSAWSKGGQSDLANCEMLCVTHNRAKGNK
ncbi:MAG: HNH endonuclease, partial [Haliea sp.]